MDEWSGWIDEDRKGEKRAGADESDCRAVRQQAERKQKLSTSLYWTKDI